MNHLRKISAFRIDDVAKSKSREDGANIRCTSIVNDELLGITEGEQFVIQTATVPSVDVGTQVERAVNLFEVEYDFERDGEQVHVNYIKGVPC